METSLRASSPGVSCQLLENILKCHFILLTVVCVFFCGQYSIYAQSVREFDLQLKILKNSSLKYDRMEASILEDLISGEHSSLYVQEGALVKKGGTTPVRAYLDCNQLGTLLSYDEKESLRLITLKIYNLNDLKQSVDFDKLKLFRRLKAVHIICEFECSKELIEQVFERGSEDFYVLFEVSLPS